MELVEQGDRARRMELGAGEELRLQACARSWQKEL